MGKAVYESTLPIDMGIALYQRLHAFRESGIPLGITPDEGYVPLIFLIIQVKSCMPWAFCPCCFPKEQRPLPWLTLLLLKPCAGMAIINNEL